MAKKTQEIIEKTAQANPTPDLVSPALPDYSKDHLTVRAIKGHTFILGIKDLVPEDLLWRKEHPNLPAMICLQDDHACECRFGCLERLKARCLWLFQRKPSLQQIYFTFKRNEGDLLRPLPHPRHTLGLVRNYTLEDMRKGISRKRHEQMMREQWEDVFQKKVPRIWIVRIPRNFPTRKDKHTGEPQPYDLFRGNFDGLCQVLRPSIPEVIYADTKFWTGVL